MFRKLYRPRANYWCSSKLADRLRGTKKPSSGTSKEWREWENYARTKYPIRYWLADSLLDWLQDVYMFPHDVYHTIKVYYKNRYVNKTHSLIANENNLKRGVWYDIGDRFLPCMFDAFVDFVDNDLGMEQLQEVAISDDEPEEWTHIRRDMLVLYWWWTHYRPTRIDADTGSMEFIEQMREKYKIDDLFYGLSENLSEDEKVQQRHLWDEESRVQKEYDDEDTVMLCKLISIRSYLWS